MATADRHLIFDIYLISLPTKPQISIKITSKNNTFTGQRNLKIPERNSLKRLYTTTLHATPHYKPSQFTEAPAKQTMIAAEKTVLTETLALLPTLLIFGRTPKCFDTAV